MFFTTASVLAALAAVSSATFTPVGSDPSGNPIGHPELGELMTAGSPFTITWTPTTQDNVSLILLQGPSTNVIPIMTIVDSIPNTGSYTWDVPTTLAPASTGYGIQLIDSDGTFQYSPQCGIANAEYSSASASASGSSTASVNYITMTLSTGANYTGPTLASSTTSYAAATSGNFSVPVLTPTASMTVPSTLQSTVVVTPTGATSFAIATPSAQPTQSQVGGAALMDARLGFAGLVGLVGAFVL